MSFTWLKPKKITIEIGVVKKLATVKNIDFKVLGETLVYTVPTGYKLIVTDLIVKTKSSETPGGDGHCILKRGSDDYELIGFYSSAMPVMDYCIGATIEGIWSGPISVVSAGDNIKIEIMIVDSGTILTFDVDLIGYLIEK